MYLKKTMKTCNGLKVPVSPKRTLLVVEEDKNTVKSLKKSSFAKSRDTNSPSSRISTESVLKYIKMASK